MNCLRVETFPAAKLNLFLELCGKRTDGYHELCTGMVAINRFDRLLVQHQRDASSTDSRTEIDCRWSPSAMLWQHRQRSADQRHCSLDDPQPIPSAELPRGEDNLVVRAIESMRAAFDLPGRFQVTLEKTIPAGAGMGGASSDAAAALLAVAKLCQLDPSDERIDTIASSLGSDVPFFLGRHGGVSDTTTPPAQANNTSPLFVRFALATGRGEQLTPLEIRRPLHFVVVYPPRSISTAAAYGRAQIPLQPQTAARLVQKLRSARLTEISHAMVNRLLAPARELSRWVDYTLTALRRVHLQCVTMTGSGSACFGIARSATEARRIVNRLAARQLGTCFVATPTRLPTPVRFVG